MRELGLTGPPDAFVIDHAGAMRWHGGATATANDVVAAASR